MQTFAYIPNKNYENSTDEDKEAIKQITKNFNRQADNMRKTESLNNSKVMEHEITSL